MNKVRELTNKLNYYTKLYDEGNPAISDREWDTMYSELCSLQAETGIIYPDSPTEAIPYEIVNELKKVEHNHPLLSLQKTKDIDDLVSFVGDKEYAVMAKMDGLTASARYLNGELVSFETRGNGVVGEDVLHNARAIKNLPQCIDYKEELIIDGEVIIDYKEFERFKDRYANSRNLASGSVRLLDANEAATRGLSFVAWKVYKGFEDSKYYSQKLILLNTFGFDIVPYSSTHFFKTSESIEQEIEDIKRVCERLGYPIDGCVIGIDNIAEAAKMGEATAHHEQYQIAYKFYDEIYPTSLLDIEYNVSRQGILTPVAVFEDVDDGESVCNRASLHNLSIMKNILGEKPFKGQWVGMYKANAIIPQLVGDDKVNSLFEGEKKYINLPKTCPICNGELEIRKDGVAEILYCINPACPRKISNQIKHYCSRKAMDIKGLSDKTIDKLVDWGWLNSISDLYRLKDHRTEWIKKSGFGAASVDKILTAIDQSKNNSLDRFICGLGIPEIGATAAKDLKNRFGNWEVFRKATKEQLLELPNFGSIMVYNILSFDYTEADEITKKYCVPEFISEALSFVAEPGTAFTFTMNDTPLANKTLCITGKLSKKRDDIITDIEAAGGKVTGSVSGKTDFLINNDVNSTTGKNKKAKELGIPIISEEELYKKIKGE